ncbi:MAG: hypothetical protein EBU84_06250 [Actinobacteria bacterium]|nr:hypothetical protein [Actinomycetota bacterium]
MPYYGFQTWTAINHPQNHAHHFGPGLGPLPRIANGGLGLGPRVVTSSCQDRAVSANVGLAFANAIANDRNFGSSWRY